MMKRQTAITSPLLAVAVLVGAVACGNSDPKAGSVRAAVSQVVPVSVAPAVREDLPVYLVGLGSVTPLKAVSVKTRVDGELVQINYREGQQVRQGDLLALIDPRPFEVQLSQAQAQLFKDQASLRDAQLNYERFKSLLHDSGAMSQQQVDTQRATADQFEGAVRTDQAAIDSAKLNLTYCRITSPISGRVGLRLVDPGNIVHASDQNPLLVVTQLQPITVVFTLPEDQLQTVAQHQRSAPLEVDAYSRDDQSKLAAGKLLAIDNEIDQTTGTGRLKAVFDNKEDALWPNQFVNIHLLLEVRKSSTVIPAAAVQHGPQGSFTYVVKSDSTVEARPVTVALTQNSLSAIAQGLNAGDVVVTDGQDKLQPGSKVQARSNPTPNASPGESAPGSQMRGNRPNQNAAPERRPAPSSGSPSAS